MSEKLKDLQGQLQDRQKKLAAVFEEAGPDYDMSLVKSLEGDSAAKVEQIKALNAELNDLGEQISEFEGLAGMKEKNAALAQVDPHPGFPVQGNASNNLTNRKDSQKDVWTQIVESEALKTKGVESQIKGVDVKTVFGTAGGSIAYTGATAGWYPMDFRSGAFVDYSLAKFPLRVANLIPHTTTNSAAITYIQEGSFSSAAVEVAEGSAKPEAALDVAPVTEAVRKIAVWIPVTDEQLSDVAQVRGYLENRLGFMVNYRLDGQILNGNGTAPNLKGILNRSSIQTQAKGADPVPDAIFKAATKVFVNDYSIANGVVLHPNDWQDIRLLRTADGIYIFGNPNDNATQRLFGMDVVVTPALSENTGLVGDFNQAELAMREGLTVRVSDSHGTYFTSNIQVILVELRAALLVYREAAFCKVTGI